MKLRIFFFTLLVILAAAGCSKASTPKVHVNVNFNDLFNSGNHSVKVEQGRVIITSDAGSQAVVTQQGALSIAGKSIAVSPQTKTKLAHYVETTQQIQQQGMEIAQHAGRFAGDIVGDVLGGLFSGESDKSIQRDADQRAAKFKQSVLPICISVQKLKQLQDGIVTEIPAFQPYAVIRDHDVKSCFKGLQSNNQN